jgi:hypothetical protein
MQNQELKWVGFVNKRIQVEVEMDVVSVELRLDLAFSMGISCCKCQHTSYMRLTAYMSAAYSGIKCWPFLLSF